MSVSQAVRQQVIEQAQECCEYCQTQQRLIGMPLVIDHIIPRSLGGNSDFSNLAASCYRCNEFKGAKTQGIDPETQKQVTLFHPRQQIWAEHFTWIEEGIQIKGLTLKVNNEYVVASRRIWVAENWHPPDI